MSSQSTSVSRVSSKPYRAVLWGGLIAGILDISAAFINSALRSGRSPQWVLQSIASGLLGADSYKGGFATACLGAAIHFLIALVACALYYAASRKLAFLNRQFIVSGLLYGVVVWAFMNLVVLRLTFPSRVASPPSAIITGMLIIMFCVGLPIAVIVRRYSK